MESLPVGGGFDVQCDAPLAGVAQGEVEARLAVWGEGLEPSRHAAARRLDRERDTRHPHALHERFEARDELFTTKPS